MFVSRLELTNFRNYARLELDLAEGVTAIIGANGQGKTSLTEALSYLATLKSFRGVPTEAMIRTGSDSAIIRATVIHPDGREMLIVPDVLAPLVSQSLTTRSPDPSSAGLMTLMRAPRTSSRTPELIVAGVPSSNRYG